MPNQNKKPSLYLYTLPRSIKKLLLWGLPAIIISTFLVLSLVFAWTEPTTAPPGGNVATPVNVGGVSQYKSGALGIGGALRGYSNLIITGNSTDPVGVSCPSGYQWYDDGDETIENGECFVTSLYTLLNGNVGIGTTSPGQPLHVQEEWIRLGPTGTGWDIGGTTNAFAIKDLDADQYRLWIRDDNGNVGIGTTTPRTRLELGNDGAILAIGTYGSGWTETEPSSLGAGTRLLWYPRKAAFRAGYVSGDQWNDANIGSFSVAMGYNSIASGFFSFAMGDNTTASGTKSVAMGGNNTASGYASVAMGDTNIASSWDSVAMGMGNLASGYASVAMGYVNTASGANSVALGQYLTAGIAANTMVLGQGVSDASRLINNATSSLMVGFNSDIPTFFVGPSSGAGTTGNVGIGTAGPGYKLDVQGGQINASGGLCIAGDCKTSWSQVGGGLPTGTPGQTLRHDGTSWVANNVLFNNGTSIGINTTSPGTYRLAIQESSSSSGYGLRVINAAGDKSVQMWVGTVGAVLDAEGTTNLHLRTAGVDRLYISNAGDIGIGTTSLDSNYKITTSGGGIKAENASAQPAGYFSSAGGGKAIQTGTGAILFANLSGIGSRMVVADASGVLSTQAIPGGATWPLLSTIDGTISAPAYSWSADTNMGIRRGGTDDLRFVTAGTDRLTIDSSGNVGIGTTTPAQKLDVAGHINMSGLTSRTIFYGATGVAVPGAGSVGEKIQLYGTAGTVGASDYALGIEDSNMWFNTNAGYKWYEDSTVRMVIASGGNVGIGTTSPGTYGGQQSKLDIAGYTATNDVFLKDPINGSPRWASQPPSVSGDYWADIEVGGFANCNSGCQETKYLGTNWDFCALTTVDNRPYDYAEGGPGIRQYCTVQKGDVTNEWRLEAYYEGGSCSVCFTRCAARCFDF